MHLNVELLLSVIRTGKFSQFYKEPKALRIAFLQFFVRVKISNEDICVKASDNSNGTSSSSCWKVFHVLCEMHDLSFLFIMKY